PSVSESYNQLAALRVAAPLSMDGYSRDKFPHWISQGNNCNTREVVLKRDGTNVVVGSDCYPDSGRWYSVYDRVWLYSASDVDIDHMVPLANSWRSGSKYWSTSRRQAFANDLSRGQLIAVSASSNRSKGDQDPSQWRPSNTNWWCYYSRHWIDVKYDYSLTITSSEKSALYSMLSYC
ncbi:MAG: GmrSD restriction endonuclease domain-containing protein, partial [Micromonosporaceae bacterium]